MALRPCNLRRMTATQLKKMWHVSPFVPFKILLPGGKAIPVPHSDFLTVSPSGRIAHVWKNGDDYTAIDVFLITALEHDRPSAKRGK